MGQFVVYFSRQMKKGNRHVHSIESAKKELADFIQPRHEKRIDISKSSEVEGLTVVTRA